VLFADPDGNLAQHTGFIYRDEANFNDLTLTAAFPATASSLGVKVTKSGGADEARIFAQIESGSGSGLDAFIWMSTDDASNFASFGIDNSGDFFVIANDYGVGTSADRIKINLNTGAITIPGLAGAGTRNVVVDANGKLSAP
jgi:hypothetical protein